MLECAKLSMSTEILDPEHPQSSVPFASLTEFCVPPKCHIIFG